MLVTNNAEQQAAERSLIPRASYIGGSAAATVLGKNDYETRYALWRSKVLGIRADLDGNPHVQRGNLVEPLIEEYVRKYEDASVNSEENWRKHDYGLGQRRFAARQDDAQIMLMHPEPSPVKGLPFIGGHPDGVGDDILWEFKCPTSYKLKRVIQTGIPENWYYQVQHYLMITKLPMGMLALWDCDRWEPYIVPVRPDPFLHAVMLDAYREFWTYVENEEPLPEGALADCTANAEQQTVIPDESLDRLLAAYAEATEERYGGEGRQKVARLLLLEAARGRKTIITPNWQAKITPTTMFGKPTVRLTVKALDKADGEGDDTYDE